MTIYAIADPTRPVPDMFNGAQHPCAVAFRNGKLVGGLATKIMDGFVVASDFTVNVPGNPFFVGLKIIDTYEKYLLSIGVTSYLCYVDKSQKRWIRGLQSSKMVKKLSKDANFYWFKRVLIHGNRYNRLINQQKVA